MKTNLFKFFFLLTISFSFLFTFSPQPSKNSGTYKILSLDGGGIRGVYTLKILSMLEKEYPFLKNIDMFAGTSTGSILAVGLAHGFTPDEMIAFYKKKGSEIFKYYSTIDPLCFYAKYDHKSFKNALEALIDKNLLLSHLEKKVVTVNFELFNQDLGTWGPCILDNFDSTIANNNSLIDTVIKSCSAPTYFPSYQNSIDGGVVANNPSMIALARALDTEAGNQKLENIRLFSVGTGKNIHYIKEDVDWGIFPWVLYHKSSSHTTLQHPLLSIILEGNVDIADYECKQILGCKKYRRVNSLLPENIALDEAENIDMLLKMAERFPSDNPHKWYQLKMWIKENFCD